MLSLSFFLGFRQRRSRADRVLTLNMNILLHCFGALEVGRWARNQATGPHMLAWSMGVIASVAIVEPQS